MIVALELLAECELLGRDQAPYRTARYCYMDTFSKIHQGCCDTGMRSIMKRNEKV